MKVGEGAPESECTLASLPICSLNWRSRLIFFICELGNVNGSTSKGRDLTLRVGS